jgi:hypothetical protein
MRGFAFAVLSLAAAASTVLAESRSGLPSFRPADPEGQFPRLGACPDPHACIFPPDVYVFHLIYIYYLTKISVRLARLLCLEVFLI